MTGPLLQAYLDAHYGITLADGTRTVLHVGCHAAALERSMPASGYTLLTAWNPQSRPVDDDANRAADAALQADLAALALPRLRTCASDAGGGWREEGWLVAGLDAGQADRLARRYRQAGILHWRHGEAVRLRMYLPRPPGAVPAHVDWSV